MRRRTLLAAALAMPAIGRSAEASVLRIVPASDLAALDPVWTTAPVVRNHAYMVFDTLYAMDAELRIQPQMVAGHVVERDGLLWTLTLREGLLFHDGAPVLARDAVASIRRFVRADSYGEALAQAIDELSAPTTGRSGSGSRSRSRCCRTRSASPRRCRASCRSGWR